MFAKEMKIFPHLALVLITPAFSFVRFKCAPFSGTKNCNLSEI